LIDLDTGARNQLAILSDFTAQRLSILQDSGETEVVVFGKSEASGRSFAYTFEGSGVQTNSINFGVVGYVDFTAFVSADHGALYAGLRDTDDGTLLRAVVRDSDGARVGLIKIAEAQDARDITSLSDGRLALLTSDSGSHDTTVYLTDLAGAFTQSSFGAGFAARDMAILDVDGAVGVAVAQTQDEFGVGLVKTKLIDGQSRMATLALFASDDPHAWFMNQLAHGHTRAWANPPDSDVNPPSWFGTELYDRVGEYMALLGASVFTRHTISFDEDPWWPSEWPLGDDGSNIFADERLNAGFTLAAGENILAAGVANAWENDTPPIAYYAETGDARLAELFPEWVAKDDEGNPISHPNRGIYLDITGEYGDVILGRILELADMGYAGVYLDFKHLPPGGLWGTQLQADYEATYGIPAPDRGRSDAYEHYMQFYQMRMQEVIGGWEATLLEQYPHFQFVVSNASVAALTRLDMGTDLTDVGTPKSEFALALSRGQTLSVFENNPDLHSPDDDIRMAFGWALLRDAADGDRPHIWDFPSPNGDHLNAFVAAVATYGGIAAIDVPEVLLAPGDVYDGVASRDDMSAAFDLANRMAPHLTDVQMAGNAAVLWDETSRNALYDQGSRVTWEEVNIPALAGFEAMTDLGLGPQVLSDWAIEQDVPDNIDILHVANRGLLGADQEAALVRFEARGGTVVTSSLSDEWGTAAGYDAHVADLKAQLDTLQTPVTVTGLPDRVHAVSYTRPQDTGDDTLVVAITNDFTFKQSSSYFTPLPEEEVVDAPDAVPAGGIIEVSKDRFPGATLAQMVAVEANSGEHLVVTETADSFLIEIPSFGQFAVVTMDAV